MPVAASPLLLLLKVNGLQQWRRLRAVRDQSRLLTAIILLFLSGYVVLSFALFFKGLKFVASFPGLGTVLTERLLYILFAFLFALLLLSNLVISYTNLFRNRETNFLLSMPVSSQTIFRWKFIESTLLASWAFLFLIAPLLAAFGLTRGVPWHFYLITLLLIALFIALPGIAGSWFAIQLARYLDRRSFQIAALISLGLLAVLANSWWKTQPATDDLLETRVLEMLDQLLSKTRFAQFPFLPSYWLSTCVIQWGEGVVTLAGFFFLVLVSHVSFFSFLAFTRLGRPFYEGVSAVQSRASIWSRWDWRIGRASPATPGQSLLGGASSRTSQDHRLAGTLAAPASSDVGVAESIFRRIRFIKPDIRALLLKDVRTFWRDTTQWGQSVMLFGLLGIYVINLRHFTHQLSNPFWVNLISYLNLGACSLNLATVTTRFVYPQFSLEGRRLWIIGMAPMGLARVVKTKYWLASFSSLIVTLSLISLSTYLLKMPWDRIAFFAAVVSVMTFSLNGLAVGLGVLYPNFKEINPAKIVSGFGGTLCLVLSFLYILASVLLLGFGTTGMHPNQIWVFGSVVGFTVFSGMIGWVPLKIGLRRLKDFEF
jgi:ABC-2 type transport system permease protein